MQEVVVFSADCVRIKELGYQRHILLSCVSNEQNVLLKISNYNPYIKLLPNQSDFDKCGGGMYIESVIKELNEITDEKGFKIVRIHDMEITQETPAIGFTNNRKDNLIKLYFLHDGDRSNARMYMFKTKKMGEVNIEHIVHDKVDSPHQLMMDYNIRFQSRILVPLSHSNRLDDSLATCPFYEISTLHNQLQVSTSKATVMLKVMHLVIFVKSSQSNKLNQCNANAINQGDQVTHIVSQVDKQEQQILYIGNFKGERDLLCTFLKLVRKSNVQVIVYCSDQNFSPASPLEYMTKRADILDWPEFNLSVLNSVPPTTAIFNKNEHDQKITGLERMDVRKFLHKMRAKPLMTGFTLLDVVRHPNIIKNQDQFASLKDLNYELPTNFTHNDDQITTDLQIRLSILVAVTSEKGFIPNAMAVSNQTDLPIRETIERGEQRRIFNTIMRHFHENKLYVNEDVLTRNSLTMPMPQEKSSFPSPPWLQNPDPQSFIPERERVTQSMPFKQKTHNSFDNFHENCKWEEPTMKPIEEEPKKKKTRYGGGLVLTPIAGFYDHLRHLVKTLDWKGKHKNGNTTKKATCNNFAMNLK